MAQKLVPDWSALNTTSAPYYNIYGGHSPLGEMLAVKADLLPHAAKTGLLLFFALKAAKIVISLASVKKSMLLGIKKKKLKKLKSPLSILARSLEDQEYFQPIVNNRTVIWKDASLHKPSSARPVLIDAGRIEKILSRLELSLSKFYMSNSQYQQH